MIFFDLHNNSKTEGSISLSPRALIHLGDNDRSLWDPPKKRKVHGATKTADKETGTRVTRVLNRRSAGDVTDLF